MKCHCSLAFFHGHQEYFKHLEVFVILSPLLLQLVCSGDAVCVTVYVNITESQTLMVISIGPMIVIVYHGEAFCHQQAVELIFKG